MDKKDYEIIAKKYMKKSIKFNIIFTLYLMIISPLILITIISAILSTINDFCISKCETIKRKIINKYKP